MSTPSSESKSAVKHDKFDELCGICQSVVEGVRAEGERSGTPNAEAGDERKTSCVGSLWVGKRLRTRLAQPDFKSAVVEVHEYTGQERRRSFTGDPAEAKDEEAIIRGGGNHLWVTVLYDGYTFLVDMSPGSAGAFWNEGIVPPELRPENRRGDSSGQVYVTYFAQYSQDRELVAAQTIISTPVTLTDAVRKWAIRYWSA